MKAIISLFMLSVLGYGSVRAQSLDDSRPVEKKEMTQVKNGPTMVDIKDGNVMVNGEIVSTISDKMECLHLKINTECMKEKPKPTCSKPCNRCERPRMGCSSCGSSKYREMSYGGYYRSESYGGYSQPRERERGCDKCRSHSEW
jgi:hypothetical protein